MPSWRAFYSKWVRKPGGVPDVGAVFKPANLMDWFKTGLEQSESKTASRAVAVLPAGSPLQHQQQLERFVLVVPEKKSTGWTGSVLLYPGFTLMHPKSGNKCMYLQFPSSDTTTKSTSFHSADVFESVLALIELGEEILDCDDIYLCLERRNPESPHLVHSLLYVGFDTLPVSDELDHDNFFTLKFEIE